MLILVDSENTQHLANAYQINDLNNLIEATQFKAAFNETLSLIGQIPTSPNAALVGVGKAAELQAAKLVKIAQTIIKASQKNSNTSALTFQPFQLNSIIYLPSV